ncbi:MAG: hypothetical protein ABFS10_03005 [Bacteroidota bacterium]
MIPYIIYSLILLFITVILVMEFFKERDWRKLVAVSMVLLVFVLRLLQIK